MKTNQMCFELRGSVALAWYYAIANWPVGTPFPRLDVSRAPVKVLLERSDAAFDDLRRAVTSAATVRDPAMASSAAALLVEIGERAP
jgi:hypothetical protein